MSESTNRVKVEVELVRTTESTSLCLSSTDPRFDDPAVRAEVDRAGRELMKRMKLVPRFD